MADSCGGRGAVSHPDHHSSPDRAVSEQAHRISVRRSHQQDAKRREQNEGEAMRLATLMIITAVCTSAGAQMIEPDTDGIFYALAHDPDRLIALERQAATVHTSAKWIGIGATAKSSSEFKPGKSPVRLNSGTTEFVVRSALANSSVDFDSFYVLRSL